MSRAAQAVERAVREMRTQQSKGRRTRMSDDLVIGVGSDDEAVELEDNDPVIGVGAGDGEADDELEPEKTRAGTIPSTAAEGEGSMATQDKPKRKRVSSAKKAVKAKAAKAAKATKVAKTTKTTKAPKAAEAEKRTVYTGAIPTPGQLVLEEGGLRTEKRNRYVNLYFTNGYVARLFPVGIGKASDAQAVSDLMVAWLKKAIA